jgi:hypothetical protein
MSDIPKTNDANFQKFILIIIISTVLIGLILAGGAFAVFYKLAVQAPVLMSCIATFILIDTKTFDSVRKILLEHIVRISGKLSRYESN